MKLAPKINSQNNKNPKLQKFEQKKMPKPKPPKPRNSSISPSQSKRKQQQPSSIRGLITNRQQSMKTESEVSAYTQRTEKTNTFPASQDFQIVDDQIQKEDIREVFVSQEEEKVIQKILEVVRKGKISQKNAFEIPLKVIDNQNFSVGKAKFWKFASQLLGASMSIYEKRIQNTWINTNLIHDKLARMAVNKPKKQQSEQAEELDQKVQTSDYLLLPIQQFRDPKILDNIRLGQETLEVPEKINIPKIKQQFKYDPLFQRKIKAFDNTSLKGLLLNVFDVASSGEIQLFCVENKLMPKDKGKMTKNQYVSPSLTKFINQNIENCKQTIRQQAIFSSVQQFRRKNAIKCNQNQGPLDSIGFGTDENHKQNPIFTEIQSFLQEPIQALESQMPLCQDFIRNIDSNELKAFTDYQMSNHTDFSQNTQEPLSQISQKSPIIFHSDGPFSYNSDIDKSFHSVMTPWEMEFKQGKLRKKPTKRREKKQGKKREKIQPGFVEFDALRIENKKLVLNAKKETSKSTRNSKKKQNKLLNLLPPQLAVYQKINYKKVFTSKKAEIQGTQNLQKLNQNLPDFLAPDPSMIQFQPHPNQPQQSHPFPSNALQTLPHEQILLFSNQATQRPLQKKYNIRQTKKFIYEKVKDQRELRISQVDLSQMTPASVLITFLHIANEKNMTVRNTLDEDDVVLSWE